ncbi:MAG: TldD/PmbA family protein, partial [bacterium]
MKRRDFLHLTGIGVGSLLMPISGRSVLGAVTPIPNGDKKTLADIGLNASKSSGATYADVRIGRYLNQFITTREDKV